MGTDRHVERNSVKRDICLATVLLLIISTIAKHGAVVQQISPRTSSKGREAVRYTERNSVNSAYLKTYV